MSNDMWDIMQQHLGYDDEEMHKFKERPQNADILEKAPAMMQKTIVAEVIASKGCNSHHKVGDKIVFDGAGNLISKLCPKRVCIHALAVLSGPIYVANELFYAGVDPNSMKLNRVSCFDVGVQCGGWGQIAMEIKVEDRDHQG